MSIKLVCFRNSGNRTKLLEKATDCITYGNISGKSKHFKITYQVYSIQFASNGQQGLYPGGKSAEVWRLFTQCHLVPRSEYPLTQRLAWCLLTPTLYTINDHTGVTLPYNLFVSGTKLVVSRLI